MLKEEGLFKIMSKKELKAIVCSVKMDKTAVVLLFRKVKHEKYKKYVEKKIKLFVHDPTNICNIGDVVFVKKTRPFSKKKHCILIRKAIEDNK